MFGGLSDASAAVRGVAERVVKRKFILVDGLARCSVGSGLVSGLDIVGPVSRHSSREALYLDIIIDLLGPQFVHGANAELPLVGNQVSASVESLDEEYDVFVDGCFEELGNVDAIF